MYTPHSVGPLWTSDQPDAETSLYLTKQYSRQTSMHPAKFETTIPASERPQTHTLDKAAQTHTLDKTATYNNSSEANCLIDRTVSLWQSTYVLFLISNFCRVLYVVCFLLGNSPASEFYMPTFRNTLSVPSS